MKRIKLLSTVAQPHLSTFVLRPLARDAPRSNLQIAYSLVNDAEPIRAEIQLRFPHVGILDMDDLSV